MRYVISGPTETPPNDSPSAFVRELDRLIAEAQAEMTWHLRLDLNEILYGSAYGPWLPPREFTGLSFLTG